MEVNENAVEPWVCMGYYSLNSVNKQNERLVRTVYCAQKAKPYLEKAMKLDPSYMEAVYIMADILSGEQEYDRSIALIRQALQTQNDARLHEQLADCLAHVNQFQDALDHYHIALSLDPSSVRAREGMERVEKHNEMGLEGSYDVEVEDMGGSDNEPDFDGSDMESTWSETDFSQP
nr:hypothetical protein BaRGS_025296 [Batillaria attramentaria]